MVLSAFHELAPNYMVRDIFSTKREEFRERVAQAITARLAGDAIVVKEVLLRKVDLPDEYAKGLEDLLLKEQEDDQMSIEAEIEQKRVQIAESQAEAAKIREVKHAEGDAQSRVIMAKADSDAMQYTLPLKQKQIEQSRLEAEARKETTIENADAEAQAKVIDSKAEQQRQNLLADAEANRIHVTGMAQAEQMQLQAAALKVNPLLVQYTVAEKLSDKVQIMLVPNDGKFFFTNDVLQSAMNADTDGDSQCGIAPGIERVPIERDHETLELSLARLPLARARPLSEIGKGSNAGNNPLRVASQSFEPLARSGKPPSRRRARIVPPIRNDVGSTERCAIRRELGANRCSSCAMMMFRRHLLRRKPMRPLRRALPVAILAALVFVVSSSP